MRIRMLKSRSFVVPEDRRVSFKYRQGCRYTVKRAWGEEMVAAGEAEELEPAAPAANAVRPRAPRKSRRKVAV
jgi:hypothetical protein